MSQFSKDLVTARSKVMANWTQSWDSFSKEGPISPSTDVEINKSDRNKNTKQKVNNKSAKKLITKENSQQLLNNTKVIKHNDSEINKFNQKDIKTKDKSIDENKQSDNERKAINETKTPNDKSLMLSKLRKRKTHPIDPNNNKNVVNSNDNSIEVKNDCKQIDDKINDKNDDKNDKNDDKNDFKIEKKEMDDSVESRVNESDVEVMEVDESPDDQRLICIIKGCHKNVNKFALFDNKYCTSECAIKQWTDEFHLIWGQKTS